MNVLLVNTTLSRNFKLIPLALMRLKAFHKNDNVEFVTALTIPKSIPDIIYFSLIFLFDYKNDIQKILAYKKKYPKAKIKVGGIAPSLKPDIYKKYLSDEELFLGRDYELEKLMPDFSILNTNYSYGFTTRGCPNKCEWCCVPQLEGKFKIIENWKSQIDTSRKIFYCFDNNIFACGANHFDEVLTFLDENKILVDFNQGMDAEILFKNKKIQEVFLKHPNSFYNLRFAWDSHRVDEAIKFTVNFIKLNKIKSKGINMIYAIYDNPNNSPIDFYERLKYMFSQNSPKWVVKMMRFKDLNSGSYIRAWGGIGDLFNDTIKIDITCCIVNSFNYWKYLLEGDLDSFIKKASLIRPFIKDNQICADEFIKYAKRNLSLLKNKK